MMSLLPLRSDFLAVHAANQHTPSSVLCVGGVLGAGGAEKQGKSLPLT